MTMVLRNFRRKKCGDTVRIKPDGHQKPWQKGIIDDQVDIRLYRVRTEDGREYRGNRGHLRRSREPPPSIKCDSLPFALPRTALEQSVCKSANTSIATQH